MARSSVRWFAAILALSAAVGAYGQQAPRFAAKAQLDTTSLKPGGKARVAVELEIEKHWHVYHPITMGVGLSTEFKFSGPAWLSVGPVRYPTPALAEFAGIEFLGFESGELFVAELTVAADAPLGPAELKIDVTGLACKETCIPVRTSTTLKLEVRAEGGGEANGELFTKAMKRMPPALASAPYLAGSSATITPKIEVMGRGELAVKLKIQPAHHILDPEPGVEGLIGTRVLIEGADGIEFGEPAWPAPKIRKSEIGEAREHAGDVTVRLPVEVIDRKFKPGPQRLHMLVYYQACADSGQCFRPAYAEAILEFEVTGTSKADAGTETGGGESSVAGGGAAGSGGSTEGAPVRSAAAKPTGGGTALEWVKWEPGLPERLSREGRIVYVDYTAEWCLTCKANKNFVIEVDPVRSRLIELGAVMVKADFTREDPVIFEALKKFGRGGVPLNLIYAPNRPEEPTVLPEVLTSSLLLSRLADASAGKTTVHKETFFGLGLAGVFVFALLGGMLLNVMPCVLPVLSLKLFSLMQQAHDSPGRVRQLGLVYGLGVLVSFVPLAALVASGQSWGRPMQSPVFLISMSAVTVAFGLALLGVWELRLPGIVERSAGAVTTREGFGGSFLNGLMATALATPCVGPFLGSAVGFLASQPPAVGVLGVMTVGVGLALPMVVLAWVPAWRRFMPKPGIWMVTFKQVMGFVLLATTLWLLSTLRFFVTATELLAVLTFLLAVGIACWVLGRITLSDSTVRRAGLWLTAIVLMAAGWRTGQWLFPPDAPVAAPVSEAATGVVRG
ncbi:MAG: thioredoxin family protein [Planctomycetia bacterium]|nr:MAG: thioredoxin family protein [Planctomycetia bacterium]